jgi:hypothetical protein
MDKTKLNINRNITQVNKLMTMGNNTLLYSILHI